MIAPKDDKLAKATAAIMVPRYLIMNPGLRPANSRPRPCRAHAGAASQAATALDADTAHAISRCRPCPVGSRSCTRELFMPGPLAGLRVLELARILAGPWAGQILADL